MPDRRPVCRSLQILMSPAPSPSRPQRLHPAVAFFWLLLLLMAPVLFVALSQDIGALAYDAATEHIYRGVVFSQAIGDGFLYPRWVQFLHWGLGSPLFTFQPPLPYYGMDILARLGLAHPLGWRVLIAGSLAAAFIGAYLLVKEISGRRWAGVVAGVAYLYAPYVLRNTLERGSTEAFSMALYPLVLWGLIWVARRPTIPRFLAATLFWAACIGSHVLGPLMLAPFAGVLALVLAWRHRTPAPLAVLLVGGLLTAAVWAPMWPEQQWVHVERDFTQPEAMPAQNPIPLDRLLAPPAVYDVARDDNNAGDRVGLLQSLVLLAGIPAILLAWRRQRRLALALAAAVATGLVLLWLFSTYSDPIWRAFSPIMSRLLYRTRLMGVQALAVAAVFGLIVAVLPRRWGAWAGGGLIALIILAATPSLYVNLQHRYTSFSLPVSLSDVRAAEIESGGTALTAFGEFTPRWRTAPFDQTLLTDLGADFRAQQDPLAASSDGVRVAGAEVTSSAWNLDLVASQATTITLHLLYYPRWQGWLDGQPSVAWRRGRHRVCAGVHYRRASIIWLCVMPARG